MTAAAADRAFPVEQDDDFELVMSRVPPKYWREYFRALAFAIRSESYGPILSRLNLKGGHSTDWKFRVGHTGRPSKERV